MEDGEGLSMLGSRAMGEVDDSGGREVVGFARPGGLDGFVKTRQ